MNDSSTCPDCKGSGKYVGFVATEACKACGGKGTIAAAAEVAAAPKTPLLPILGAFKAAAVNQTPATAPKPFTTAAMREALNKFPLRPEPHQNQQTFHEFQKSLIDRAYVSLGIPDYMLSGPPPTTPTFSEAKRRPCLDDLIPIARNNPTVYQTVEYIRHGYYSREEALIMAVKALAEENSRLYQHLRHG